MTAAERALRSRVEFAACLGLFCNGVYATALGPALPVLANDFHVPLDSAGLLLAIFFAGSITASGATAGWLHRRDPRHLAMLGLCAAALGNAALAVAGNWRAALAAELVTGLGDGLLVAGVHLVVARASSHVARGMNRLNVFFALGAMAGPLWSGAVLGIAGGEQFCSPQLMHMCEPGGRAVVFGGIAVLLAAIALLLAATPSPAGVLREAASEHAARSAGALAWFMGAVLFFYVGAEFGLGSWVAAYAASEFKTGLFTGGVVTSVYWGALMLGRLASGWLFARGWQPYRVLLLSIAGGLLASSGIVAAHQMFTAAVLAAFLTGLFFGPIWPAVLAIVAARAGGGAPAAMVTVGNAGGVFFPWAQGRLFVAAGALTGIALTAVLCAAMLCVAWVARFAPRDPDGPSAAAG